MLRETAIVFLPSRHPVALEQLARTCPAPWRALGRRVVARAERSADGRRHLVVIRSAPGGLTLRVTGVRACEGEILAPIAARIRDAVGLDDAAPPAVLRGTSPFENALRYVVAAQRPGAQAWRVFGLGPPCPSAPTFRAAPTPDEVLAVSVDALGRRVGSLSLARRLQALARAFAPRAHSRRSASTRAPTRESPAGATARSKRCTRPA